MVQFQVLTVLTHWHNMQYRKKPVIIEATQWFPKVEIEGVELYKPPPAVIGGKGHGQQVFQQDSYHAIHTLEGWMRLSPGDWVITGVKGELYPCHPDIFEQTYEKIV